MAMGENEYYVTYEIRIKQVLDPVNYGHLDGELTPQAMADSDIHDFVNHAMMLEEFLCPLDDKYEIKAVAFDKHEDEDA